MKLRQCILPVTVLGIASFFVPTVSRAFSLGGIGTLPLGQRDVRVFNNFADAQANSNTTPHPSFPGYTGAELACWKAVVEWGSALHGDGTGDPHQPGDLGSGGANFDASWQGNAPGVGAVGDNVISEITGNSVGVFGFTEAGPSLSTGWRIRLYSDPWVLHDDPAGSASGLDLQGAVSLLYGFALGLGQSLTFGATMNTAMGSGVNLRSLHPDDIAGIQALYGTAAATKPMITGVELCNGVLVISGANFGLFNTEVWFTRAGGSPDGVPVKAITISTTGGTKITVAVPPDAGPGDVLVRNTTGVSRLSNAYPFDPALPDCTPFLDSFCFGNGDNSPCTDCPCGNNAPPGTSGGCLNASGTSCTLAASGFPNFFDDTLRFDITGATPMTFGLLLSADNALPANSPSCPPGSGILGMPGLDGLRCVGGNLIRHGTRATDASGSNTAPWGPPGNPMTGLIAQGGFGLGAVRHFQVFHREDDTLGCGTGQNTSNAVRVTVVP